MLIHKMALWALYIKVIDLFLQMANTKTLRSCIQSFWPYKTNNIVQLRILKYLPSLFKKK